jgi:hypothetical protein
MCDKIKELASIVPKMKIRAFPKNVTNHKLTRMLQHFITSLVTAIRQSPKIRAHAQLKSEKWTKSCFEKAANIIISELDKSFGKEEKTMLGTTISAKTISNMFRGTYRLEYPIDPRSLNTLTKLVRFLGFQSWESFTDMVSKQQKAASESADPAQAATFVLREALALEFMAYRNLPGIDEQTLENNYVKGGPAINRIMDNLRHFQSENLHVANPYNPSHFEIIELEVRETSETQVKVRCLEIWVLCWWSDGLMRYLGRHKTEKYHYYTLLQTPNGWQVYSNSTLSDITEIED